MNLGHAVVFTKIKLLLRRDVLVAEEDDAPLGDEQRELVLLLVREVLELQALDLGTDVRRQVRHLGGGREQGALGLFGPRAGILVLPFLVADLVHVLQVQRPRWSVRVTLREVHASLLEPVQRPVREAQRVLDGRRHVHDGRVNGGWGHGGRDLAGGMVWGGV